MKLKFLVTACAVALMIAPVWAEEDQAAESAGWQMMYQSPDEMPMMGTMRMMHGSMMGNCDRVEGTLAFLKAELKIGDTQNAVWDAYAAKLRELAKGRADQKAMGSMMRPSNETWPVKIAAMSARANEHAERLKALSDATAPLYAALSEDQKKTADDLLPMTICSSGMMHARSPM
jgi:hypothetical protein